MIDVSRMQGCITVLLNTRPSPIKGKHLIQLSQVDDKLIGHQITAKGYLCSGIAFTRKHPLQEGRVEHYIPVIGHKQISLVAAKVLQTTESKAIRSLPNQLGNHPGRELTLNSIYSADVRKASQLLLKNLFAKQIA